MYGIDHLVMQAKIVLPLIFSVILILGNTQAASAGIAVEDACRVYAGAIEDTTGDYGIVTPGSDTLNLITNVEFEGEPAWITGMDFNALSELFVTVGEPTETHFIGQLNPDTGVPIEDSFVPIVDGEGNTINVNDLAIDRATGTIYGMGDPNSNVAIYTIDLDTIDPDTAVATKIGDMWDMVADVGIANVVRIKPGGISFSGEFLTAVAELQRGPSNPNSVVDVWQFNIDVSEDSFDRISDLNVDGPRDERNIRGLTYCANGSLMYTRDTTSSDVGVINSISGETSISSQPDQLLGDIAVRPGTLIGGSLIPIDSTTLVLAGAQMTSAWMIPIIVGGIGFAIVIARKF